MHVPSGRIALFGLRPQERDEVAARLCGFVADVDGMATVEGDDRVAVMADASVPTDRDGHDWLGGAQLLLVADRSDASALSQLASGTVDDVVHRPLDERLEARVAAARARAKRTAMADAQLGLFLHDLNNPLTAIRILADMLIGDLADGESARDAADVLQSADLATANIEALTTALTSQRASTPSEMAIDIAHLVRRAVQRPCMRGSMTVDGAREPILVEQPAWAVEAVVNAMLLNARSLVGDAAGAHVQVALDGSSVSVEVTHTDVHLAGAHLAALADPFGSVSIRVDHVRVAALGLGFARRLAVQMGGALTFSDRPEGLRVALSLPR